MTLPIINFTNPFTVFVALVVFLLLLFLGRNTKKSYIMALTLFVFLTIIVFHTVEISLLGSTEEINISTIAISIAVDFVFIFLSFISYLWIDEIEAKAMKKRSIDNSLDWFWSKV